MRRLFATAALALFLPAAPLPLAAQDGAAPAPTEQPATKPSGGKQDLATAAAEISAEVEDDRGFITRFLERNLSGAGRQVVIHGFQGALSSRATFDELTIADDDGVWITLRNGAIQWDRSALFARRIQIRELSASEILLPRLPGGGDTGPTPEAREFALPTLPVSVDIARIAADRAEIGAPVIGEAATVRLDGAMNLAGGEGTARLSVERLDGKRGVFSVDTSYSNTTTNLDLDLTLDEDRDGLFANLVGLYGRPSVRAEIQGSGPLRDFAARFRLATDGQDRVTGMASAHAEPGEDGTPGTGFRLELSGDVASLLPPGNRAFFGAESLLLAQGWRGENGQLSLPALMIDTQALKLTGSARISDEGAPQSLVLLMTLGEDAGATTLPVRLPLQGDPEVRSGRLQISYDAAKGDEWTLHGGIEGLATGGNHIEALLLDGGGTVQLAGDQLQDVLGRITFGAKGLALADPGLQAALGQDINGDTGFEFAPGNALELAGFSLSGRDFGLFGDIRADGLRSGITVSGVLDAAYEDASHLSRLAGRPLTGQISAELSGLYTVLSRGFDAELTVNGLDVTVDQEQLDRLLAGEATVTASARRDETGIELRELAVDAQRLVAQAQGTVSSTATDLRASLRLASLTDADPSMAGSLTADAAVTGAPGARRVTLTGEAADLVLGIAELDRALQGRTDLDLAAQERKDGFVVERLWLHNPQITAEGHGSFGADLDAEFDLDIPSLTALRPEFSGALRATARAAGQNGNRRIEVQGTGTDLRLGQQDLDGALTGTTDFRLSALQGGDVITIDELRLTNDQMAANVAGVWGENVADLSGHAEIRSLAAFGRGWRGALEVDGSLRDDGTGVRRLVVDGLGRDLSLGQAQADAALAGETRLTLRGSERSGVLTLEQALLDNPRLHASAQGTLGGGGTDVTAELRADNLAFLGNGFGGSVTATGRLTDTPEGRRITADGTAGGLRVGNAQADRLLAGTTLFDGAALIPPRGPVAIERLNARNGQLSIRAGGSAQALNVEASLADLALLVPGLPGAATLSGSVRQGNGNGYALDLTATAPGGTRATIAGTMAANLSTADIRVAGVSDAALVNPMLRTRSVEGPVNFDLRLSGRPALESLSGQVRLPGARLADPNMGLRVDNLTATADIAGGLVSVNATAAVAAGGTLRVTGPVDLRSGVPVLDLRAVLDRVVLRDPNLYETIVSGTVSITGNPDDGPLVAGSVRLGPTEFRIPTSSLGGHPIPDMVHLNDTTEVRATRAKAGLLPFPSADSRIAGMVAPPATPPANPARLDLTIDAPNQVFVRGRGVDAELGGRIRLTGTARNMVPIGQLELIRGRVDLLGRRFTLTEGLIEMQGSMVPVLRLVAETTRDAITTRIIIDGDLRDPDIRFESVPGMPEEEVLSQLLFGRGLDSISALQAAQLANAVAVLAGKGGEGLVGNLRNATGLDDLDLTTDENGQISVRAGRYLSRNLYTDVAVDAEGKSRINLNLDVNDAVTARGSVTSDGESTIGIFYERDY